MGKVHRRSLVGGCIAGAVALHAGSTRAQVPKPPKPLRLNVVDAAGNLQLSRPAFAAYAKAYPDLVSGFAFTTAPSPEVPAKLKAQQNANRVDIDLVIIGPDNMSPGIEQRMLMPLLPQFETQLPDLEQILLTPAWHMQQLTKGYGVIVSYYPSGPLLEYMPDKLAQPPKTADELLAYTKQNPNRFTYARPTNSGPARTFLMGLPYILGDKAPKDPKDGWDRTWSYLKELGDSIDYYPSGTAASMTELGEGTRDIITTTTGWDINPRALGIVPKSAQVTTLKGFRWVTDAHYFSVPAGLDPSRLPVLLHLISFMLTKPSQAFMYDLGYLYPGPAVKGVPISVAPQQSQDVITEFGRPEYAALIADTPYETPLDSPELVYAFRRWDEQIGRK